MVEIEFEDKIKNLKLNKSKLIVDLMVDLKISPEAYVCILNGNVVTENEIVTEKDKIKFARVWSGG